MAKGQGGCLPRDGRRAGAVGDLLPAVGGQLDLPDIQGDAPRRDGPGGHGGGATMGARMETVLIRTSPRSGSPKALRHTP
eukprot:3060301-Lingulodinium_polyedra.AAC.1